MGDRTMPDLQTFLRNHYEESSLFIDDAFKAGIFDVIKELRVYNNGVQEAYLSSPKEVYEYFKSIRIVKFYPWTAFCYEDDYWTLDNGFHFKFHQKKPRRKNKIPGSQKEKIDKKHRKIKGEPTKGSIW